jgi:hypothetical protein
LGCISWACIIPDIVDEEFDEEVDTEVVEYENDEECDSAYDKMWN